MTVYERIRQRRKELGLSAEDLARALGVSRATVYRYESAETEKLPSSVLGTSCGRSPHHPRRSDGMGE